MTVCLKINRSSNCTELKEEKWKKLWWRVVWQNKVSPQIQRDAEQLKLTAHLKRQNQTVCWFPKVGDFLCTANTTASKKTFQQFMSVMIKVWMNYQYVYATSVSCMWLLQNYIWIYHRPSEEFLPLFHNRRKHQVKISNTIHISQVHLWFP